MNDITALVACYCYTSTSYAFRRYISSNSLLMLQYNLIRTNSKTELIRTTHWTQFEFNSLVWYGMPAFPTDDWSWQIVVAGHREIHSVCTNVLMKFFYFIQKLGHENWSTIWRIRYVTVWYFRRLILISSSTRCFKMIIGVGELRYGVSRTLSVGHMHPRKVPDKFLHE